MLTPNQFGVWQIDLTVNSERCRKSTRTKDKALAQKLHAITEAEMLKGSWGIGKKSYSLRDAFRAALIKEWVKAKSKYKVEQNWSLLTESQDGRKALLDSSKDVSSVTIEVIADIKIALYAQGNSGATINRKMAVLKRLLNICVENGKLPYAPKFRDEPENEPRERVLTDEEEVFMMRFFREKYSDKAGLIEFLLSSANRLSECLKLTWFDVDFKNNRVTFKDTKSKKTIVKPMTSTMFRVLEERKGLLKPFPYSIHSVESNWKTMRKSLDLQDDAAFVIHCLRHTCATRLAVAGVPLLRIQLWLGHSNYKMTERYVNMTPDHMNDVVLAINDVKDFDRSLSSERQSDISSQTVVNLRSL